MWLMLAYSYISRLNDTSLVVAYTMDLSTVTLKFDDSRTFTKSVLKKIITLYYIKSVTIPFFNLTFCPTKYQQPLTLKGPFELIGK